MNQPQERILKPGLDVKPRENAFLHEASRVSGHQCRDEYHQDKQNKADNRELECSLLLYQREVKVPDDSLKQRFSQRGSTSLVLKYQLSVSQFLIEAAPLHDSHSSA
jgi:hypothetical protein